LRIIRYPHPTLRHVSKTIRRVDAELTTIVERMFDLMYEAQGIGLAANQVDLPLRFFVVNLAGKPGEGEERVFLNPVITRPKGSEESEEGCLSLPGMYGDVTRPKQVRIHAYDVSGNVIQEDASGMLARVLQHELDHLDGVLFFDRMDEMKRLKFTDALEQLESEFAEAVASGELTSVAEMAARRSEWERTYC